MDDVLSFEPEGTPNSFVPSGRYPNGFKFEFQAGGQRWRIWGHGQNPNLGSGSNAGAGPTVRIQVGDDLITTGGGRVGARANWYSNDTHIPLDSWGP